MGYGLWGALGGAAKGAEKGILLKAEEESKQREREAQSKQADIDFQRQMRLEKMRQKTQKELEETRQGGATERTGMQIEAQENLAAAGREHDIALLGKKGEQQKELIGVEGDQSRATETLRARFQDQLQQDRIAGQKALEQQGIDAGKYQSGNSFALRRWEAIQGRFEDKVLTVTEANEQGLPIEQDTPAVYDNETATWYLQQDDKYVRPGTPPERVRRADDGALQFLYRNPQSYQGFMAKYGYLPAGFFGVLRQSQSNQLVSEYASTSSSGNPQE